MSSYSSTSSFLSGSDFSTSPSSADGSHFPTSPEFSLAQTAIIEEEPLTHPLLHKSNLDVTVTDNLGFPVMQTKSAWEKQMKEKEKLDERKNKKAARKAKHAPRPPPTQTTLSKKEKKEMKHFGGKLDVDDDA